MVRRCRVGRRGWSSGGYPRPGGEACCSARLDSRGVRVVAPTNEAARSCRRRRDCCLPAATAGPASVTGGEWLRDHRAALPAADRPADVGEPPDVPPPGARVPPACSTRPRARRRPETQRQSGVPLGSRAGGSVAEMPPETLLATLGELPERNCQARIPDDGRATAQDPAWRRLHRPMGGFHQGSRCSRGRRSMHRWCATVWPRRRACPHRRERSHEACGRLGPPPLRRRTSHTRRDRRAS